jgi:uncharacterized protein (TIGR04255 family)
MTAPDITSVPDVPVEDRLSVPLASPREYARNYTKTVVCELRFPTLVEINPQAFKSAAHRLRRRFPNLQQVTNVGLYGPGQPASSELHQQLRTRDGDTALTIRNSALSLETQRYRSFETFRDDVAMILDACTEIIDADYFTRVGLRYINHIPLKHLASLDGWINPQLRGSLEHGHFGRIRQHITEVRGFARLRGEYTFRFGLPPAEERDGAIYLLDIDFSMLSVDIPEMMGLLDGFRAEATSLFEWAIGDQARTVMEDSSLRAKA